MPEPLKGQVISDFADQMRFNADNNGVIFLKSKVSVNKPTTTYGLKVEVEHCINDIQPLHIYAKPQYHGTF